MLRYNARKSLAARNRSITKSFFKRADKSRYGSLWTDLENQYTRGINQYPRDLTRAYTILLDYRKEHVSTNR